MTSPPTASRAVASLSGAAHVVEQEEVLRRGARAHDRHDGQMLTRVGSERRPCLSSGFQLIILGDSQSDRKYLSHRQRVAWRPEPTWHHAKWHPVDARVAGDAAGLAKHPADELRGVVVRVERVVADVAPGRVPVHLHLEAGFGRTAVSEIEAPNTLVSPV